MKKNNLLLTLILSLSVLEASSCKTQTPAKDFINHVSRPYYIGHRGSKRGKHVENTRLAYSSGARAGYDGLETDIRVSKDGQMFCFHDNDLTRLTYNKYDYDVNQKNFDEIKNIELYQTINNIQLGPDTICTFDDYLDICKKYDIVPIIELKWTNGINDNDFSNIPMLLKKIKDYGLEKQAFVMTSMKKCLEYIRDVDKDIHLQWLCSSNITEGLEWAVDHEISIDVQYEHCTKEIVDYVHAHNLYINIWTLNDESKLKSFLDMGVDFITTDTLLEK